MSTLLQDIKCSLIKIKANEGDRELDNIDPGEDLFELFCKYGCGEAESSMAANSAINIENDQEDIKSIAQLVADLQHWLLCFLHDYSYKISLDDYEPLGAWQLVTRSGIQFLFDLFKDVQVNRPTGEFETSEAIKESTIKLGALLEPLKPYVECIDSRIEMSKKFHFIIEEQEIPAITPKSHHWWW